MKTACISAARSRRSPAIPKALRHPLRWVGLLLGLCLPGVATAEPSHPTLITRIDVDGNGTPDFEYRGGETFNPSCSPFNPGFIATGYGLFALNGNQVLRSGGGCTPLMASLPVGSTPEASPPGFMNWGAMGELLAHEFSGIAGPYYFGPFHSATNGYAAVRFSSPAGLHYGWIQFTNAAPDQPPAVARFAAESRVNTPLEIGRVIEDAGSTNSSQIRIPGSATVLGSVTTQVTTNATSGDVTRKLLLEVAQDLTCLTRPDPTLGPVPVALEERRLLSATAPSDASWTDPNTPLLLLDQVEPTGGPIRASGPLAGRPAVLLGIGNTSGDRWWIEVLASGENRFVGHSHINQGPLVVGQPPMNSQSPSIPIDLDGDRRMDFAYQPVGLESGSPEHWLHPFRNHRILAPLYSPRGGTTAGPIPPPGSWWTNAPVILWRSAGSPDRILDGTNGFVAVEFVSGTGTRYGWIQFNYYIKIHGVSGWQTFYSSFFDFIDYGLHPTANEPVLVGSGSAAPDLTLQGNKAILSWSPLRSRSSLEWSGTLTSNAWTVLTTGDQTSYTLTLPRGTNQAFFRLRPPIAKPPAS